jgi:hypothetical protein
LVLAGLSLHILNVHARDQSRLEAVHMVKRAFRNLRAVERADHLADADDASVWRKLRDLDRFIVGACESPSTRPVSLKLGFAVQPGAAIGPIHILAYNGEQSLAVLSVVGRVSRQQPFFICQCASAEGSRFSWSLMQTTTHGIF